MRVSSWCHLPHLECLDSSEWSHLNDIEDTIDNELLSLLKSQSRAGKGNQGDWGLQSLHHLLCSWPLDSL